MKAAMASWTLRLARLARRCLAAAALLPLAPAFAAPPLADCPPAARMPTQVQLQAMLREARDRGVLWRVEHAGRTSWLYGTVHVARPGWSVPGPTVMAALRASDSLALELNLQDPAVMQVLQKGLQSPPDAQPLPEDLAGRLTDQLRAACLPAEIARLRPDAQVMTLLAGAGRRQGLDPAYGIDFSLAGTAMALGKPVIGLETPERQLRELVSDDPQRVTASVTSGLRQLESGNAGRMVTRIAQAWADGRLDLLESVPEWCDCVDSPAERADYERSIYGRNPGMAQAMAQQLRAGRSLFAAVGSLHMVGSIGLPALLQAEGFKVQRVPLAPPGQP